MTQSSDGEQLISDLLADSRKFDEGGRAYALLQRYFEGLPLETLRPLLRSEDAFVQRAASFVASELGGKASSVIDDIVPLVSSTDRHVQWYAMEVLAVCGKGEHAEKFAHVVRMLRSADDALRRLAMRLMANADISQLDAVRRYFEHWGQRYETHRQALMTLTVGDSIDPVTVATMLRHEDALVRRYGAIAARRLVREYPDLMSQVRSSEDPDLRSF
ncbi:hypothetical protein WMF31_41850 [Sorangium sp. So ce1036]|uniref:HEAT repeat domain-containing protein n=1 Tax=Sorangium sp. So ce1036 TaxID=3133328 RepID=UPI003F02FAA2